MRSQEFSGHSVDEAIFVGLTEMGVTIDEVEIETIQSETKGLFGIGAKMAVVRLTGATVETFQNDAMRRGTELEPAARAAYEAHTGELVEEVGFIQHPKLAFVGVSPDGLLGDDGLVELKCPANMAKHLDALRSNDHAKEYRWQLQGQLWVTGRQWVDAVSFDPRFPEHLRLAICRVNRDESAIAQLSAECCKANDEIESILHDLKKEAA